MRSLVAYDSQYGNTKMIAEAIGAALESSGRVFIMHVSDVQPGDLMGINRLIVGSPTQQLSATSAALNFIKTIPRNGLKGVNAEKNDLDALKNKLANLLIGEKNQNAPESPPIKATEKTEVPKAPAPVAPNLPEPPVIIHVRNPNKQSS